MEHVKHMSKSLNIHQIHLNKRQTGWLHQEVWRSFSLSGEPSHRAAEIHLDGRVARHNLSAGNGRTAFPKLRFLFFLRALAFQKGSDIPKVGLGIVSFLFSLLYLLTNSIFYVFWFFQCKDLQNQPQHFVTRWLTVVTDPPKDPKPRPSRPQRGWVSKSNRSYRIEIQSKGFNKQKHSHTHTHHFHTCSTRTLSFTLQLLGALTTSTLQSAQSTT